MYLSCPAAQSLDRLHCHSSDRLASNLMVAVSSCRLAGCGSMHVHQVIIHMPQQ